MSVDLSNWMKNLSEVKKNTPIVFLAIPGSHDSMTYEISKTSNISPDAEPVVQTLAKYLKPLIKHVMFHWSVTQRLSVKEQLELGIRYLDLRIATKTDDTKFYFVHGMYGDRVEQGLLDVAKFLEEQKEEVVILDFQHFYSFHGHKDHIRLAKVLKNIFGNKLCPRPRNVASVTLQWMLENGYQVITIYRNTVATSEEFLWTSKMWPTPWPNTMSTNCLLDYLAIQLAKRPGNAGFVSQCVLTPQNCTIVKHPFGGILKQCAKPACSIVIPWIQNRPPGSLNVAIADFVDEYNALFPRTVVSLNYK